MGRRQRAGGALASRATTGRSSRAPPRRSPARSASRCTTTGAARAGVLRVAAAAAIPESLRGEVAELGRILGYTPHRTNRGRRLHSPRCAGQGADACGVAQHLQRRTSWPTPATPARAPRSCSSPSTASTRPTSTRSPPRTDLPKFTPTVVGGQPSEAHGETTMDLEVAHAIAPDAAKVVVNARPTVEGDGAFEKIAQMFEARRTGSFPVRCGASRSAGAATNCITAADLAPVRSALSDRTFARHDGVQCQR